MFLADDFPEMNEGEESSPEGLGGTTVTMHRYVPDCDAAIARAVAAGAEVVLPIADMFWGDRFGKIREPFGHEWSIATHITDPSPEEMAGAAVAQIFAADQRALPAQPAGSTSRSDRWLRSSVPSGRW